MTQSLSSRSRVYNHPSLQVPWHAVLGNHDSVIVATTKREAKGMSDEAGVNRSPSFQLPQLRVATGGGMPGETLSSDPWLTSTCVSLTQTRT